MDPRQAKDIGRRIAAARKDAGEMTQRQLAELLNVSLRSVQDYEHGVTVPWKHFDRLEQIFARPLRYWLHGELPPQMVVASEAHDLGIRRHDELMRLLEQLREQQVEITRRLAALERQRARE